jgi:hypothetical protein
MRLDFVKENMDSMAEQLRLGCKETREKMIQGYMSLVHSKVNKWIQIYPGLEYLSDDMESEGYLAVIRAVDRIATGERPENTNVTAYVSVAIINGIGDFLDNSGFIRIPRSSDEEPPTVEPIFEKALSNDPVCGVVDIKDTLDHICRTDEERAIVDLLSRGYTEREVGSQLDMAQSTVNMLRIELYERYTRLERS